VLDRPEVIVVVGVDKGLRPEISVLLFLPNFGRVEKVLRIWAENELLRDREPELDSSPSSSTESTSSSSSSGSMKDQLSLT
jgi:hypothetical protein